MIRQKGWYVYLWEYENRQPFYIGKGTGKRAMEHLKNSKAHNACMEDVLNEFRRFHKNPHCELIPCNSESEAFNLERTLIQEYARSGILTNIAHNDVPYNFDLHRKYIKVEGFRLPTCEQYWLDDEYQEGTCKQSWPDTAVIYGLI
jgi:excinuclease UvrABC nuclease subunit